MESAGSYNKLVNTKDEFWQMSSRRGTGIKSVILSALAAAFGVQKKSNLERDFQQGKPAHYIIAGVAGTALFVVLLIWVVRLAVQAV